MKRLHFDSEANLTILFLLGIKQLGNDDDNYQLI